MAVLQCHGAAHAGQQAAGQGRRHPAPIDERGDVAKGAFGDLARLVPQHGVEHAGGGGRKRRVVRAARGLVAHKLAVCGRKGAWRQLQAHGHCRGLQRKGLGARAAVRCQQQAHPPVPIAVLQGGNLQLLAHRVGVERKAKMRSRLAHSAHMLVGVHEFSVVQAQCFKHLERSAGPLDKGALVVPLGPFGARLGTGGDAAANAAGGLGHDGGGIRTRARTSTHAAQHHGADGHVKGSRHRVQAVRPRCAARPHHAHRAAIDAARRGLQRADHLHGAHLGRPRDGATREQRRKHIRQRGAGPRARRHVRGHLPHRGQGLRGKQRRHLHTVRQRNARHVVAQQVHDHHVLGTLLGRRTQVLGLLRVLLRGGAARGRALHGAGQQGAAFRRVLPVKKQLGRHRQHLLVTRLQVGGITPRLSAQQRGKQGLRRALQRAAKGRGVIDLIQLARRDGLLDLRQRGVKRLALGAVVPHHLRRGRGRRSIRRSIRRDIRHIVGPWLGRVVHRKPGQRAVGRMGLQCGIEGRGGLVAHMAQAPASLLCGGKHGVEHTAHLVQCVGHQHLARCLEPVAQARSARSQRLGEVNAATMGQSRRRR